MTKIPAYELVHNNEDVSFAIRSIQDVMKMFGDNTDKPHMHNYYTVLWSHNNAGKHIIDYNEFDINPNDVFFVTPGQVHQVNHNENPEGVVILFTCDFLGRNNISKVFINNLNLFSEITNSPPIRIGDDSVNWMNDLVNKMSEAITNNDAYKFDIIGSYLKLFLIECNKYAYTPKIENTQSIQSGKVIIQNFKSLLESNFVNMHKVSDYADQLNITSDYLNKVIKSTVGKTAKELIQQRLVLEAKRLGLHTELSTKEIAYRIGFEDPSHFSRFFKNNNGLSFTDFRSVLIEELSR
ncbi:MAG: helix-turn-helix transcriptional regulator [Bacteroidales bacterium]|nr:helix-turn-helix transcriptional regulator [Bacteroidales bacterium]